mmetsp:Transcript_11945/g.24663  ORF Transcript_11945/g.24663 Transcript_11945/m.24663 type:complete len:85 (+) Transcript_11945:1467-1721(+)
MSRNNVIRISMGVSSIMSLKEQNQSLETLALVIKIVVARKEKTIGILSVVQDLLVFRSTIAFSLTPLFSIIVFVIIIIDLLCSS